MSYVPDAYDLWAEHEAEMEAKLRKRPVCDACGEYIQDEYCYKVGNEVLCRECMVENFRISTESLMED